MSRILSFTNQHVSKQLLRLTGEEIEALFNFVWHIHDHEARTPAIPLYWERLEKPVEARWAN